ncbi:hypothetical protein [Dermacoccus sp. 147Ba]|uniref:hypothetical protein n=1 Tax=Dermacoccus sp. 147Ba TaxID=2510111 RepID=UPI0013EB4455|nr:hypothetical protein [Dermacoccus sp. 147Ba]
MLAFGPVLVVNDAEVARVATHRCAVILGPSLGGLDAAGAQLVNGRIAEGIGPRGDAGDNLTIDPPASVVVGRG